MRIWNPIDFQGQRSRSQGLIFRQGDTPRFALPLLEILLEVELIIFLLYCQQLMAILLAING
jgi:hypothetical protein